MVPYVSDKQPSHYLHFVTTALMTMYNYCYALLRHWHNFHMGTLGFRASAVVIKVDTVEMFSTISSSPIPILALLMSWCSVHSICVASSSDPSEILLNKHWTLAIVQTAHLNGTDQWADEMQLDCISETLMVALFYTVEAVFTAYWSFARLVP